MNGTDLIHSAASVASLLPSLRCCRCTAAAIASSLCTVVVAAQSKLKTSSQGKVEPKLFVYATMSRKTTVALCFVITKRMASTNETENLGESDTVKNLKHVERKLLRCNVPVDELPEVLDNLDLVLSTVNQLPSEPIQEALVPSMKALISDELLRHTDEDVKISVTSCIAEITRITAPDTPYDDEQMKIEVSKMHLESGDIGTPNGALEEAKALNLRMKRSWNLSSKDMLFRANKIDLKSLDDELEKHLTRVLSRHIDAKRPK
ncbi:hypothetical protein Ahy_B08g093071 isoform C [Arachis hypogaea]|uniref:Uncharacterized protein n=2 Tax=Arachis hypogaea TaxID=3818 RepID=A0A444Y550_ARAHY|nr:hypothetical protein Ahy_B08g093071 isoform C [Arachis hypogaea]